MTLEEIYYIGQTIAVVAILISLAAIYFQIKQSTRMERAAAQREVLDRVADFTKSLGDHEVDMWVLGLHDLDGAPFETKNLVHRTLLELVFITESALNMHRDGFFSEGTWAGIEGVMLAALRTPGGQSFWSYAKHLVGFEIANHLETRMAQEGLDGPTILDVIPYQAERLEYLLKQAAGDVPLASAAKEQEA